MPAAADMKRLLRLAERDPDVLAVLLFGSQARREPGPTSDVDVCVVLNTATFDAVTLSQKKLDYASAVDLDVQIFQQLPLYVRRRILKEGRVLLVRDEDALYDLAFQTARAFGAFRRIYESYLNEVAGAGP